MPRSCSCAIQSITAAPSWHLAHLVGAAGVVEDPLGRRGLARVDVGHDPDVPDVSSATSVFVVAIAHHQL
jgi:hypothetical protein